MKVAFTITKRGNNYNHSYVYTSSNMVDTYASSLHMLLNPHTYSTPMKIIIIIHHYSQYINWVLLCELTRPENEMVARVRCIQLSLRANLRGIALIYNDSSCPEPLWPNSLKFNNHSTISPPCLQVTPW